MKPVQEPEKIDVKIGSKEEAFLTKIKDMMVDELVNCQVTARLNKQFLDVINKEIALEKKKFK